jgi:predicted NAD-dependent protein-ADP-ribosyltransferase YbiA (DUF1768 family)
MSDHVTILYRPVGPQELALIAGNGYREFPARLPEQPFFYPVINEEYARQIAWDWNVKASGAGYVTRFAVRNEFVARYPVQTVGGKFHKELWVPAEELSQLNRNIIGQIEVIAEFTAKPIETERICFYRVNDAYGEFSNFSPHKIQLKKRAWPTSEHYFQAQKLPMIAALLGRTRSFPIRSDWETIKDDIMRDALWAKFTQHSELKALLLSTGEAELVEHTKNDKYWADAGDGTGNNRLGQLLMELRTRLRTEDTEKLKS